jgi:hypothetical protein
MQSTDNSKRRQEPFGMVALGLALAVMLLPLEADTLWALHRSGRFAREMFLWWFCFLLVAIPLAFSWRRVRRNPGRWKRGFENMIITAFILALNLAGFVFLLMDTHLI